MDYDKRRKEIDELVADTRFGLTKYSSFEYRKYYVDVLKLQELQEINDRLQEVSKIKSEDGKLYYSFFHRFNSLDEALKYIDGYKDSLPKIADKLTLNISSDSTTVEFNYKTNVGVENEDN